MSPKPKKRSCLLSLLILLLIGVVLPLAGFLYIRGAVIEQFGKPAPHLTMVQQVLYPVELFVNREALTSPADSAGGDQSFLIDQGESISMVCLRLEGLGMIKDADLMRIYLVYSGMDRRLQSGQFILSPGMTPIQIAAEFLDATPTEAVVTVLAGWRIEEVAANVAGSGLAISAEAFINAAYAPPSELVSYLPLESVPSLEGFLFPGKYVLPREAVLADVFKILLTEFSENMDTTLLDSFARQGLSLYEAVTLASIIEKEAVLDAEKPMIASVLFNRLANGIKLETDPTVQYGLGYQSEPPTWWKAPLATADLSVSSPYNTYREFGLPPTPICNPDLSSLRAVAFPAETPYFYFRAACDGSGRHNFSITFEEHVNNACE